MAKPTLRNPGPWTFAIFASACVLVGFLFWRGAPDAAKLAGSLIGILVSAFGAKSALGVKSPVDRNASKAIAEVAKLARPPMETWPEVPLVNTPITEEDSPVTQRNQGKGIR